MHRLTISLPEELAAAVTDRANREGTSVSEIVRRAVLQAFGGEDEPPALPFAGLGHSGQPTTARDAEEILSREWSVARRR